jgi:hypothetical protein
LVSVVEGNSAFRFRVFVDCARREGRRERERKREGERSIHISDNFSLSLSAYHEYIEHEALSLLANHLRQLKD